MNRSGRPGQGSPIVVRPATPADLPRMAAIYNEAVATTVATFDLEPRPDDHYADLVSSTRRGDHVLVAVTDADVVTDPVADVVADADAEKRVVGFAYAGTYRPRPAYDSTRETSVYLSSSARGRGVGRALYDQLLDRVDTDGIHTCLAVIARPNPASEALHLAVGFDRVGTLREVGCKFGRWVDTGLWQRIGPASVTADDAGKSDSG
ncbi:MAG: GNAT family N-acetyltransferase [Dermatophilaceae bacterium]